MITTEQWDLKNRGGYTLGQCLGTTIDKIRKGAYGWSLETMHARLAWDFGEGSFGISVEDLYEEAASRDDGFVRVGGEYYWNADPRTKARLEERENLSAAYRAATNLFGVPIDNVAMLAAVLAIEARRKLERDHGG